MSTADLNIDANKIVISMDQVKADATMVTLSMPNIVHNMDGIKMKDIMSKLPIIMEIM
ncbi:1372_t:CDS:2, partial [Paraglomus brasilianum]